MKFMKNRIKILGLTLVVPLLLSSCLGTSTTTSTSSDSNSTGSSDSSSSAPATDEGYEKVEVQMTLDNAPQLGVFSTYVDGYCPTVGSPKMVVFPLGFSDTDDWTEEEISIVEKAYSSETLDDEGGYYSLAEYYKISSYGNLTIDVTVVDPMELPFSCTRFEAMGDYDAFIYLLNYAMTTLVSAGYSLSDFDTDGDGVMDGVHFIYKTTQLTYQEGGTSFWWNYTSYRTRDMLDVPYGETASPCIYFFSDYDMMLNEYYGENIPDTHTIIHETGHMLGLDDYYDYNTTEAPAGGADMMDLNIGDHNPYSKMLLGWTDPYVVNGTSDYFQITLKPFAESGEFIVLRNTDSEFNQTPFDEYLTLSYYTPTSLNELDSIGYPEWMDDPDYGTGGTYSTSGLQVFHVDSRLMVRESGTTYRYWDPKTDTISSALSYKTSNTPAYSSYVSRTGRLVETYAPYRLIEAITSDGIDHFGNPVSPAIGIYSSFGNNSFLFGVGDEYGSASFDPSDFTSYFYNRTMFNDYTTLNYSFEVTDMNDEGITIVFTKIV